MDEAGSARPEPKRAADRPRGRLSAPGARPVAWVAAWAPVAVIGVLAFQDVMGMRSSLRVIALVSGLVLLGLTMLAGIRELRAAETRSEEALARAEAAEAAAHARAEELQEQLSETQRMQQQMVQASKMAAVGELAAAVAHEVNNPLTGILGFSELLLANLPANDPRRADVAVIHSEAVRARGIVRALLEFARPRPPQRIKTDINPLVRSVVDLVRFRAQEHHVAIVEDYGDVPDLQIDPDAVKQVLLNLFSNAFEAMPRGGEIRVSTLRSDDRIGLRVADNGVGMDASTRNRIFTPFFTTRAGSEGGTGLGLSVGLRIVESLGGSIEVATEAGTGSAFTIWLPLAEPSFRGAVIMPAVGETPAVDGHAAGETPALGRHSGGRGAPHKGRAA
jgi:signal transduction histidine kinase